MELIRTFIVEALHSGPFSQTPFEEWDEKILPLVKDINSKMDTPVPEQELIFLYSSILSEEIEVREEKKRDNQDVFDRKEIVQTFLSNKTKGTYLLAEYIVKKYNIITVGEKEREMFVYQGGMYHSFAENLIIFPEIQKILEHHVNKNAKSETLHKIADMTSHPRAIFESAPHNLIPLKNGVYDLNAKELLPHSPSYRFLFQFPINYDPKATCPKTIAFFEQVLTPDQIPLIQEWLGYYFYRYYMFKKAVIFVGEGDTGKTTLLEVIINLLGKENTSSVSLQKMASDKFAAAHLYNKHGNLVDELSAKDITDTGSFKMATGGGTITGEYKFGNQFSFQNFSKYTFACNKIPDVTDFNDVAYFNRWVIVRFEKTIEKKIPNFILTLQTEEERSGLFNYAMEGLNRLLSHGLFSYGKDAMETKAEMMRSGSSIAMFAAEQIERQDGIEVSKEEMYEAYVSFCNTKDLATETIKMLGTKLPFYVSYLTDGFIDGLDSKGKVARVRGWRNGRAKERAPKAVVLSDTEQKVTAEVNNF